MNWRLNSKVVSDVYGMPVDEEDRFYICPFCGEPIYEVDWTDEDLKKFICPICEDIDKEEF